MAACNRTTFDPRKTSPAKRMTRRPGKSCCAKRPSSNMPARIDGTEYQQVMPASRRNCTKKRGIQTLWPGTSTEVAPHNAILKMSKVERSKLRGDGQAMRSAEEI